MESIKIPAIVFTSANFKGQPLISDNQQAYEFYENRCCDALLYHNRNIINKQDDSVVREMMGRTQIIRRSRGFVPEPVMLVMNVEGILAMGADIKNSFCAGKDYRALMSQYIGDLENYDVFIHYKKTISDFESLFNCIPRIIALDAHPEYHSSRYGRNLAKTYPHISKPAVISVQHHHAHIASVMAEHHIDEKVIGVAMDGTGFGDDGKIWGSEFFVCDFENYQRFYHLDYLPLPGGDKAIREPWRAASAVLYRIFGDTFPDMPLMFTRSIELRKQHNIIKAMKNKINIFESCGMGRLFDIAAALLNLAYTSSYDGEGPMKLESICYPSSDHYPVLLKNGAYSYETVIRGIINDLLNNVPQGMISGRFHNTIASIIYDGVEKIKSRTGLKKVALSGGIFQNKIVTEKVKSFLSGKGYEIYTNVQVPCNDGGVALGQMAIASKKLKVCV